MKFNFCRQGLEKNFTLFKYTETSGYNDETGARQNQDET